ncbi:MAG: hypothetical protein WA857_18590 [Candidatus Acidiferrum sp.]
MRSREQNDHNETGPKVFIGGSRRLSRLNQQIKRRLDSVIDKGLTVIVGDANGVDKAVQSYLAQRNYENVTVFCMAGVCRNNVGNWPTREIFAGLNTRRDATFFGTKDRAMGAAADYGLMLWDGKSRGTLANVRDLIDRQKPVVVYLASSKSFFTLRRPDELADLLSTSPVTFVRDAHSRQSDSSRDQRLF